MRERLTDGKLHALVNNAGISPKGAKGERLGTLDIVAGGVAPGVRGQFLLHHLAGAGAAHELAAAQGAIVNVTSIAGSRVHPFAGAAYATSKAALAALTREMAADFGPLGVRVNAIAPGEIDTAILSPGTEKIVEHHAAAPPGPARRSRQGDLLSVYGSVLLCHRRGTDDQWRPRLTVGVGCNKTVMGRYQRHAGALRRADIRLPVSWRTLTTRQRRDVGGASG